MIAKYNAFFLLSALVVSSGAMAGAGKVSEKELNKFLSGDEDVVQTWISNSAKSDKDYSKYLNSIHSVRIASEKDAHSVESGIISLMSTKYILEGKWEDSSIEVGNRVMKNDNLIDLERPSVGSVYFSTTKGKYFDLIDYNSETYDVRDTFLTSTLMRNGYPAIGPDAKPIMLCRLIDSEYSSLYEVSNLESGSFVNDSGSEMTIEDACVTYPGTEHRYWKARYLDLTSKDGY